MARTARRRTPLNVRRKRVWARQQTSLAAVGQDGVASLLDTGFTTAMGTNHMPVGVTIGGVLLDFHAERETVGTSLSGSDIHIGVICTQEDTEAEVPRPLADPHADWMWWQRVSFFDLAIGANTSTWDPHQGAIQVKARRKCEELGEHLWLVVQGYDIAPEFTFAYTSSVLLMLP